MGRLEELRYIYQTRRPQMDNKLLYELIDLLLVKNDELMETIEDVSNNQDREESEPRYDRSDMD